jgi:Glycosyl transferase family 64 domain
MKKTFLGSQFQYLFLSFPRRKKLWHRLYFFYEIFRLLSKSILLRLVLLRPGPPVQTNGRSCVVVLLSHNRPQNLEILVRGALQNGFVRKIIVSNSNPKFHLADWVKVSDARLQLIDEKQPTLPGHRFVIAAAERGDYFLSVDDDIFFTPKQWAGFFECLLRDGEVPHGISGQLYRPGTVFSNGSPFHHRENIEAEVDVLIGAYAFTRVQLNKVFKLADALHLGSLSQIGNGEDILLSFAGSRASRIHDLGRPLLCASTSLKGVALSQTRVNFWDERIHLFEAAQAARRAMEPCFDKMTLTKFAAL